MYPVIGMALAGLAAIGAFLIPTGPAGAQDRRVALVIGNDTYRALPSLHNAVKDARDLDNRLRTLGWETILKTNVGRRDMTRAIGEFGGRISGGAAGLVFFAGHGVEAGGQNFLVPVDAEIESDNDLESEAVRLGDVMGRLDSARNPVNVVILDACRDNPIGQRARSAERGLAVIPSTPTGLFVAYSAAPGQKAQDGAPGANGIFTGELIKALAEPGLKIEDVFKRVSQRVLQRTSGRQVPWIQASLRGDFYFAPPPNTSAFPDGGPMSRDALVWQGIQGSVRAADFETFLKEHPGSPFGPYARSRIEDIKRAQTAALAPSVATPSVALDPIDREYHAVGTARIREAPDVKSKQVASLRDGEAILVLGKVKGLDWYLVEIAGRPVGYVSRGSLEDQGAYLTRTRQGAVERAPLTTAAMPNTAPARAATGEARSRVDDITREVEEAARRTEEQRAKDDSARQAEDERSYAENRAKRLLAMVVVKPSSRGSTSVSPAVGLHGMPAQGTVVKDCAKGCPEMVVVHPGRYRMGASPDDREATLAERPNLEVNIDKPFAIGAHEVTKEEFSAFAKATRYASQGCTIAGLSLGFGLKFDLDKARNWENTGFEQTGSHPVVCVSFQDAQAYMGWLTRQTGWKYRLPSEAEWEYVARAGATGSRPWGDHPEDACSQANVGDQLVNAKSRLSLWPVHSCFDGFVYTAPVASFPANAFGVFDMLGNAWEWTEDCWIDTLAGHSQDARAQKRGDCAYRAIRGGSWFSSKPETMRVSYRTAEPLDHRAPHIGFRIARDW
ncbi:MAG: hypothetical protein FJX47_04510 [Alphaproteobacteria bacterium]|nr:hypothetical protein [Alphaproteobacteria bacterium]